MGNRLSRRIKPTIFAILVLIYLPFAAITTIPGVSYATTDSALSITKSPNDINNPSPGHTTSGRLIVELKGNSLAEMYAKTPEKYSLSKVRRLAPQSRAARQYRRRLRQKQDAFVKKLQNLIPEAGVSRRQNYRGELLENRYQLLFNGVSINPGTANRETLLQTLRQMPEVKAIYPDRTYHPALFSSRNLINAKALWNQPTIGGMATAGCGVKIAIIDAGIHHLSPMFSGTGFDYPPEIPAPGLGDPRNNNGKIIVSRAYFRADDPPIAGDGEVWPGDNNDPENTHGVHVAGIAAGNPVSADFYGLKLDLGGVAPAAWLMSYRVLYTSRSGHRGCWDSTLLAAIEDAVADGADIINLSILGDMMSAGGYYDPVDQALIRAARIGVFVTTAGGNAGPEPKTSAWPSAAYTTVAAGTKANHVNVAITLSLSAPQPIPPELDEMAYGAAEFGPDPARGTTSYTLVSAAAITPDNPDGCQPWSGQPFADKAVLIERGSCDLSQKVFFAQQGGAKLVIIYNYNESDDEIFDMGAGAHADEVTIPSFFVSYDNGQTLRNWCADNGAATRIKTRMYGVVWDDIPDRVSDFSSRGPGVGEVLKPDLMAPGAKIVSQGAYYGYQGEERCFHYGVECGTSMAAPHVAGAAALIRQVHPQWPVSYIKSALMTTTKFRDIKTESGLPAVPLEIGAGRLDLTRVTDPGIICLPPSVSFGRIIKGKNKSLTTTITNVTTLQETYTITAFNPRATDDHQLSGVSFSPSQLTLEPGASGTLTLTVDTKNRTVEIGDLQGFILLTGTTHKAHLPLWARVVQAPNKEILLIDNDGSSSGEDNNDYLKYYTDALDSLGKSYDIWDADVQPSGNYHVPAAAVLSHYPTLVYFTGNNWKPIHNQDINRLVEYYKENGRIIAMGQDLSFIFPDQTFAADFNVNKLFYHHILGGNGWPDGITNGNLPKREFVAHDDAPSAFNNIHLDLSAAGDGAANQFYIDELLSYPYEKNDKAINNLNSSYQPLLRSPGKGNHEDGTVAIAHRNQPSLGIPEPLYAGRSVYTSFGLEGVNNLSRLTSRSKLLGTLLNWTADEPVATIVAMNSSTMVAKDFRALLDSNLINSWGETYRWDFGDGSGLQGPFSNSSCSHTYARPGNYLVQVEATDNWGNKAIGKYLVSKPNCLYYPHVATAGDWETEICIINSSPTSTITGKFTAYADDGSQVSVVNNVALPPRARREITVGKTFSDPDRIGYIIFSADDDTMVGYTKFYRPGIYRVAVPAVRKLNRRDIFVSHIASDDNWFTGLSLVNVTTSTRTLFIESDNGLKRTLGLAPGEHKALSIRSLFSSQPQPGIKSAVIRNCAGIIGLELFGSDKQLSGILLRDSSATEIIYPHVVSSSAWWTGVAAYNCAAATGHLKFTTFNEAGDILANVNRDLNEHSKFIGSATALGFPEETAWFRIKSTQPITGFELFGTSNGLQLAGYSGVNLSETKGVFAKLEKEGFTGIAMVNASSLRARVTLTAYGNDGHMVGNPATINLGGYEKVVKAAEKLFPSDISKATYISYNSDRRMVGFQLNGSDDGMLLDGLPALR